MSEPARFLSLHLPEAVFVATTHREWVEEQWLCWDSQPQLRADAARFARSCYERMLPIAGDILETSGYRCPELNEAVGGRPNSRHMLGIALDFAPRHEPLLVVFARLAAAVRAGALPDVDELLIERGRWIHVQGSLPSFAPRQLVLTTNDGVRFAPYPAAPTPEES